MKTLPRRLKRIAKEQANGRTVELWFQDEARVGQVGRTGRVWYERGVRPRGLRDMRHEAAWIFGAICPERDTGVALVLPEASVPAMQALIDELASQLPADRHAVLVMDRAGWHIARKLDWPDAITPMHLPPCSPELNALLSEVEGPIERVWLYLRERFLSHRLFDTFNDISTRAATPGTTSSPRLAASPPSAVTNERSVFQESGITRSCLQQPVLDNIAGNRLTRRCVFFF